MEMTRTADDVAHLQDQVSKVCSGLFNFIGALQRDAPPSSIEEEPVISSSSGFDVKVGEGRTEAKLLACQHFTALQQTTIFGLVNP